MGKQEFENEFEGYLEKSRYNQSELAEKLGVHRSAVTRWKLGENKIPIDMLDKICHLFELNEAEKTKFFELAGHGEYIKRNKKDISPETPKPLDIDKPLPLPPPPPRPEHFINRKNELEQLLAVLQPGRIVTLCGPAGIGKSALAAEVVWRLSPDKTPPEVFPDGIVYHNFDGQPEVALALEVIARVYGEELRPTLRDAARRALGGRRALVVLDGADNADDLWDVLSVVGSCGVLIISRTTRDAVDDWQELPPLSPAEAVKLLQAWGGAWAAHEAAVQEICELVGRLPLAVRLVGRYLAQRKVRAASFLERLRTSPLQTLDQGKRRDDSVPLLLKHNLDQVSEEARQIMAIIGLLALHSFDRGVVAAAFDWPLFETEDRLGELVSYGMLLRPIDRYKVSHRLIHTYAQQMTVETQTIVRMANYYTVVAEPKSEERLEVYRQLDMERPHLMRVLEGCEKRQEWQAAINLAQAIDNYLKDQGHWTDRENANQIGQAAAYQIKDRRNECIFWTRLGRTLDVLGREDEAKNCLEQKALPISQEIKDQILESQIWEYLGTVYRHQWEVEKAIACYNKALEIAQKITGIDEARNREEISRCSLGRIYTEVGQVEQAIEHIKKYALAIAREIKNQSRESVDLGYLGAAYSILAGGENKEKAVGYYQKAWEIAVEAVDHRGAGNQLLGLGKVYDSLDKEEEARKNYEQALDIANKIQDFRMEIDARGGLAHINTRQGQQAEALIHIQKLDSVPNFGGSLWVYLKYYKVLRDSGESRAQTILKTAYDLLTKRADKINDEALRHSFLNNVPVNKEIRDEFEKSQLE